MEFTKIPTDTFNKLQINAGFLTTSFTPNTATVGAPMAATTGGLTFTATPEFQDFGEDIDNCPKNTKELKRIISYEVTLSGTMLTIDHTSCELLLAACSTTAPASSGNPYKFTPSMTLASANFKTLWFVGDYSANNASGGGFIAIKLMNALNTGGFQMTTTDKGKGQFAFTFTGHVSISSPDTVPFEIYIKEVLQPISVVSEAGSSTGKTKLTVDGITMLAGLSYMTKTAASVTLPDIGEVVSTGWTAWSGTDEITATTGNEIAVVVVDSTKAVAGGKTTVVSAT